MQLQLKKRLEWREGGESGSFLNRKGGVKGSWRAEVVSQASAWLHATLHMRKTGEEEEGEEGRLSWQCEPILCVQES